MVRISPSLEPRSFLRQSHTSTFLLVLDLGRSPEALRHGALEWTVEEANNRGRPRIVCPSRLPSSFHLIPACSGL